MRAEYCGHKVRVVTVLNLVRHFALSRAQWPARCARLEELLKGHQALLPEASTAAVEAAAQRYAALLLARQGERLGACPRTPQSTSRPKGSNQVTGKIFNFSHRST